MALVRIFMAFSVLSTFGLAEKIDYRLLLLRDDYTLRPRNCTETGFMCEDCQNLVMCTKVGENEFEKKPIMTCQSPATCLEKQCTTSPNPICSEAANLEFTCNDVGVFPDPFDCQKYHFCVPSSDNGPPYINHNAYCESKWSYNAMSKVCDKPLNGGCETSPNKLPVPICDPTDPSKMVGALDENKSIYYICSIYPYTNNLYPFLYMCPNGKIYENYDCVENTGTTTPTTTPGSTASFL